MEVDGSGSERKREWKRTGGEVGGSGSGRKWTEVEVDGKRCAQVVVEGRGSGWTWTVVEAGVEEEGSGSGSGRKREWMRVDGSGRKWKGLEAEADGSGSVRTRKLTEVEADGSGRGSGRKWKCTDAGVDASGRKWTEVEGVGSGSGWKWKCKDEEVDGSGSGWKRKRKRAEVEVYGRGSGRKWMEGGTEVLRACAAEAFVGQGKFIVKPFFVSLRHPAAVDRCYPLRPVANFRHLELHQLVEAPPIGRSPSNWFYLDQPIGNTSTYWSKLHQRSRPRQLVLSRPTDW
jgi:hypothetical protein